MLLFPPVSGFQITLLRVSSTHQMVGNNLIDTEFKISILNYNLKADGTV